MLYPELEQKIKTGAVKVGDLMWVTGYYQNKPIANPSRHVPPTLVQVTSNTELPAIRKIPSGGYHFRPWGKSGKVLSRVILPYEGAVAILWNSGDSGSLDIFLLEKEAKAAYVAAAYAVKLDIAKVLDAAVKNCARLDAEVDERIAEHK